MLDVCQGQGAVLSLVWGALDKTGGGGLGGWGGGMITEGHKPGVQPVMDSIIFIICYYYKQ